MHVGKRLFNRLGIFLVLIQLDECLRQIFRRCLILQNFRHDIAPGQHIGQTNIGLIGHAFHQPIGKLGDLVGNDHRPLDQRRLKRCRAAGNQRYISRAAIGRELTKLHETVLRGTLSELEARVAADPEQQLGEFVVMIAGAERAEVDARRDRNAIALARRLATEMSASRAVKLAAEISGASKNVLYRALTDA